MSEHIADFIVLGLDVIEYSIKPLDQQHLAQDKLDRSLQKSITEIWPEKATKPYWVDAGDGGYALFEGSERTVLDLLQRFYELLARENKDVPELNKVLVRAAIHCDQIMCWETRLGKKYTGHAINNCARLLSGMPNNKKAQVVCSGTFYEKLKTIDQPADSVRLKDITDKHGIVHSVHNIKRSPGFGVTPENKEKYLNPLKR